MNKLLLGITHLAAAGLGFAAGIYLLPILSAPQAPSAAELARQSSGALYQGEFRRDLQDSDALHWGEGRLSVGRTRITFAGRLAPGPAYRLYLSPEFVETEADFLRLKPRMVQVGAIDTFDNFIVNVPPSVDVAQYTAAVVWCEAFSQFITAARYR